MPTHIALRTTRRTLTTLTLSAVIVTSFAVNPGSASAAPSRASAVSWGVSVLKSLNAQRAVHHLPPLASSARLLNIAHLHNVKMAAYNQILHQLPGESAPRTRIARAGFSGSTAGENLAQTADWTLTGAQAQQRAMYNETSVANGRRANILTRAYRYVGVDVAVDAVHHKLWITEDFSTLPPAVATPSATTGALAIAMLKLLNVERAAHGRAALRMNTRLIQSAHGHNVTMARANTMSHLLPGEAGFLARLIAVGYQPRAAAENIGWNSNRSMDGVLYLQRIMYNEVAPNDAHRVNILNTTYREVGVDVYMDNTNHKVWITQDFGLAG
jgi:uncharacterized protein YkwD